MNRITIAICCATVLLSCNSSDQTADNKKDSSMVASAATTESKDNTYKAPDSATMMKNWQAYATPGKEHQMMAENDGAWIGDITMWQKPGGPAMKMTGTAENKMILGGRYQQATYKGMMMGMPFEGISTLAFDNAKKVYISTWIDNMGTGVMQGEGKWDEASKSLTISGNMVDPARGDGKECHFREVMTYTDKDHNTMEMYVPDTETGKEFKSMEIKYTRKK